MVKNLIYLGTLLLIIIILAVLPIVKVPISSSSREVIRSITENTQLSSVVSGKVIVNKLQKNNQVIRQGDTLLVVATEQLDTQKQLQSNQTNDYAVQLHDLGKLTKGKYSNLQTGQYQFIYKYRKYRC